jgi:hypothetical protein
MCYFINTWLLPKLPLETRGPQSPLAGQPSYRYRYHHPGGGGEERRGIFLKRHTVDYITIRLHNIIIRIHNYLIT